MNYAKMKTAEDLAAIARADREAALKMECRERILAVADSTAQINMASAAAAGQMSVEDMVTYQSGVAWVADMRAAWPPEVDTATPPSADSIWPTVPAGVADLAGRY